MLVATAICTVLRFSDAQELNVDLAHSRFSYAPRRAKTLFKNLAKDEISENAKLESVLESLNVFWIQQLPRLVNKGGSSIATADASNSLAVLYVSTCLDDFLTLFQTLGKDGVPLGFRAVDALGKPGSGILDGNIYMYGSLDECLDIGRRVKYWLAPMELWEKVPTRQYKLLITFKMGMCVPQSCGKTDLQYFANRTNEALYNKTGTNKYALHPVTEALQTTESQRLPLSNGAIAMITVCAMFLSLVAAASVADGMLIWLVSITEQPKTGLFAVNADAETRRMSTGERTPLLGQSSLKPKEDIRQSLAFEFLSAFSLFKTVPMILSTKQPPTAITSLNGIRVLSMFWVILVHTFYWVEMTGLLKNPTEFIATVHKRFSFQAVFGGTFCVDSFFFLSGTLVAYLTLREMERKRCFPFLTYFLHRYLRLTMVYAFLLFFWWTLTVYFGKGHGWNAFVGPDSAQMKNCERYWWTNLLYVNNFYPWRLNDECMGWSWYLANDMQFYMLAPLIIIPLYYFFPVGLVVAGLFLVGSTIASGVIASTNGYTASYIPPVNVTNDGESDDIYVKPYCRVPPYLVGLILGFLIYKRVRFPLHWILNYMIYTVIWLLSAGLCFAVVYGLYNTLHGHILTQAQNISYFMFSRFSWGLGLALLVFSCHNGYGCVVNNFLSMKFWIPLSRLTYSAYLIHPIFLSVLYGTTRDTFVYTDYKVASMIVSNVVLSYGMAGVVAAFVEFPLSNLEIAVFKLAGLKQRASARMVAGQRDENQGREPSPPNATPFSSLNRSNERLNVREPSQ